MSPETYHTLLKLRHDELTEIARQRRLASQARAARRRERTARVRLWARRPQPVPAAEVA